MRVGCQARGVPGRRAAAGRVGASLRKKGAIKALLRTYEGAIKAP
jgi:hypothetical protein